jgi:lipoate-protein ligase A
VIDNGLANAVHSAAIQPRWTQLLCPHEAIEGDIEMHWLDAALDGQATAALWTGQRALVAPLSYRRHAQLGAACAASGARGWPVRLRRSGGGVVPQGPGILNVTLAYPCAGPVGDLAEPVYAHLCQLLTQALTQLGIEAQARSVQGSFCDGRFNLAVSQQGWVRKIAGTAQYWRRASGRQAVLAHALLLVDADPEHLSAQANQFEAALASGRHYKAHAMTSVAQCWQQAHPGHRCPADLMATVRQALTHLLKTQAV